MMNFIRDNWEILSGVAASVLAYFGGKKSKEIQEKRDNSDAVQGIQNLYGKFVEQTDAKFESMREEMDEVKKVLSEYMKQCDKCENNKFKK